MRESFKLPTHNWRSRICVRLVVGSVVDFVIVDGPKPFIAVLVRPELQVHAVLVEQRFEREESAERQSGSDERLVVRAVVSVLVRAVHRPMSKRDNPRAQLSVLRLGRLNQILLQPLVLVDERFDAIIHEIINFRREANEVNRAHVEAVEHVVVPARHAEARAIVGKVAESDSHRIK